MQQKFADEIVHMIGYMGSQQKKQLEGLEELAQFTSRETEIFMSETFPFLLEQVHQNLAKATLASQWLNEDVAIMSKGQNESKITSLCSALETSKVQVFNESVFDIQIDYIIQLVAATFTTANYVHLSCSKTHMLSTSRRDCQDYCYLK